MASVSTFSMHSLLSKRKLAHSRWVDIIILHLISYRVAGSDETADKFDADDPHLTRKMSKRGSALKLKCIGKQESDENPLVNRGLARNAVPPSSLTSADDNVQMPANHVSPGMHLCKTYFNVRGWWKTSKLVFQFQP